MFVINNLFHFEYIIGFYYKISYFEFPFGYKQ